MAESDYILQVVQVSKAFGANKVLKEVNLNVRKGEVHGWRREIHPDEDFRWSLHEL